MFNGIIFNKGLITKIIKRPKGINIFVKSNLKLGLKDIGVSVACDGVCFSDVVEDCAGVCGGEADVDSCGVCDGDNADIDDCGVCFGSCDFGFEYQSEYQY